MNRVGAGRVPATLAGARARLFASTWFSYAGFYFCRKAFSVVKGPIKATLQVDDFGVSHLFTAFLVSYMLGQFAVAWLGRRMQSRTLLLAGMALAGVANLALGFFLRMGPRAYGLVLAAMVVQGAAQATGWPANVALLANWTYRSERGKLMAVWGTCYQLGSGAAKWFAAFLFGWLGLAWPFWGSALVLLSILLLFGSWIRESPAAAGGWTFDDQEPAAVEPGRAPAPQGLDRRLWRTVVAMGLIYLSIKFLRYALDSWSSLVLAEHFGLSTAKAGYLSTAFDLVGFLGVLVGGWYSDRVPGSGRSAVVFAMTVGLWGSSLLLYVIGPSSVAVFVILLGAFGFFVMGPDSLLSGAGAMDVGTRRDALVAAALINGLGSVGPPLEEPIIGWLKAYAGLDAVLLLFVAVATLAVASTGLFWASARHREPGL